jgi:hypothetical protein
MNISLKLSILYITLGVLLLFGLDLLQAHSSGYRYFYPYNPFSVSDIYEECPNKDLNDKLEVYSKKKLDEKFNKMLDKVIRRAKTENVDDNTLYSYINYAKLMKELTPIETNTCLVRIGKVNDGGYVLADLDLEKIEVLYSYGIEEDTYFERYMADKYNSLVRMYDYSINSVPYNNNFSFFKEFVTSSDFKKSNKDPNVAYGTIDEHLDKNKDRNKRKILKVDIEREEFNVIKDISNETLRDFDQIVMEVHSLYIKTNEAIELLKKINENFYIIHVHSNNYSYLINVYDWIVIPHVIEVSWVRKDLIKDQVYFADRVYPMALDAPNNSRNEELILDMWPFKGMK